MTEEDKELEALKAKRLAEMQRNLAKQENQEDQNTTRDTDTADKLSPRDRIIETLGYRGLEVLTNAESQFPNEAKIIVEKLGELIASGDINETLDGGKLFLELITICINGYPLPSTFTYRIQLIGVSILFGLIIFVTLSDIINIFNG